MHIPKALQIKLGDFIFITLKDHHELVFGGPTTYSYSPV